MKRDRKTKVVNMLLAGNLQDSRLMLELSEIQANGLLENQARYESEWKAIEDSVKKHGDRGFDGQKETVSSTFISTRESIERKYSKQVELYTRACTIKIEEEHLFLSITKAMPYGLTPQQKADLLEAHSTEENKAQEISIGEKKFILFDAKIEIPSNLLNEDPRENEEFQDWILDALRHNVLFAVFLATEWASELKYQIA
jgi:hypothetical protein